MQTVSSAAKGCLIRLKTNDNFHFLNPKSRPQLAQFGSYETDPYMVTRGRQKDENFFFPH